MTTRAENIHNTTKWRKALQEAQGTTDMEASRGC